jgi:hypothetical protein
MTALHSTMLNKLNSLLKRPFGNNCAHYPSTYKSETSKCRDRLLPYCSGYGVDLGFGGDPICTHAIRVDSPRPYADTGDHKVQLGGDAANLYWFKDGVLDFVYSSHLLEDFQNTEYVLKEWLRVLKVMGNLVLFCPDEEIYRAHCRSTGQIYNSQHQHADFSLVKVKNMLLNIGNVQIIHETPLIDTYSWELVARKQSTL